MKQVLLVFGICLFCWQSLKGQSLELMPGTERVFVDAQWLKTFDEERKWSLFSRSRATTDYEENTSLFTGAYLNYTGKAGFGGTLLGSISSLGSGGDVGVHFFKAQQSFMIYALASIQLQSELGYSWFSILRYTPKLSEKWRVYSSLELFSSFLRENHLASVQRIRAGLSKKGYQFGLALNLSGLGKDYSTTDSNPGVFIRKEF